MKALVYCGPETLAYRNVIDPVPGEGEALVQVSHTGICGSDMHAFLGHDERRPEPLILGHEVAGTVVSGALSGQRVTVNPLVTCGQCVPCLSGRENLCAHRQIISMPPREGGFAEFVAVPERNLVAIPDHVSNAKAALVEPIACGWHGVRLARRALADTPSDLRALVIGGGAIGLGAALSLKAQGFGNIQLVEPNVGRAQVLRTSCAIEVLSPAVAEAAGAGDLYDLIVDGVGYGATRAMASSLVRPGGVIVHIGLGEAEGGLDIRRMTLQEITFIGTYTYSAEGFHQTAKAMFDGLLGALDWTEILPLSDGLAAFESLRAGRVDVPKILLAPENRGDKDV